MVLVPDGEFIMGDINGRPDETPHLEWVPSFYIDRYPVTQELYEHIMGVNPSKRKGKSNPVERTQWTDAVRFCNKCSEAEGLKPCYDLKSWECDFGADGYRLPTEAEWEYACRAGTTTRYCCGDSESELSQYAWFKPHSNGMTRPVGQKKPNRWGLYDVHGNVWQWCNDYYSETYYAESPTDNPHGPATGQMRVLRGGAWDCEPEKCRSAYRHKEFPVYSDACFGADSYGFRRARNVEGAKPGQVALARSDATPRNEPPREKSAPPDPKTRRQQPETTVSPGSGASPHQRAVATAPASAATGGKIDPVQLHGTIVFVSDRSSVLKIWTMHASGKNPRQLTHDPNPDADPKFSPDGKQILYTTLRAGFPEVWLMNRDGSNQKSVTHGSQASWSPDGKALVFIRDNQTFVRDLSSEKEKRLTPVSWERCGVPAWSPDGKHVAVASRHLGAIGIFLLTPDGKQEAQLRVQEGCCTPRWSSDGKRILCQTVQGHIHQVDVDGKNWEQMTFGADVQHDACYSPDGSMILFCRAPSPEGPWQICVQRLDADELDFVQLTHEGSNLLPDWHAAE
jgi:formylglycine-generating enzyme required for sulfatase activity